MNALALLAPRRLGRLLASDAMNIGRDPMLLLALAMSFAPAAAFFVWRAAWDKAALNAFGIAELSRYAAPIALLIPAALVGWVTGFLMLEERDDGPLLAIDVTPVGKVGLLAYRATFTAAAAGMLTLIAAGPIVPTASPGLTLALAILVAAAAVLAAFVLPAVARNKVEGLALTKITNLASVIPLVAIVPSPWRYLAGVVPTYWLGELLRLSTQTYLSLPVVLACAVLSHVTIGAGLLVLLRRRAG